MAAEENMTRKQQVILRATKLFKIKGYAATSMRDLANSLGIEAASLYSHIKSKEEILQGICFGMAEEFTNALDKIEKENIPSSNKLHKGIVAHTEVIARDLDASAVFLNEYRHLSQPFLRDFLLLRINYINRFKKIIQKGITNNEFKNIDKKLAVMTIFSSLNWMPNWYNPMGELDQKELGQQLATLLIKGLKQKSS